MTIKKYIENYRIVDFSELPKIGEIDAFYNDSICVEIKVVGKIEEYVAYDAKYKSLRYIDQLGEYNSDSYIRGFAVDANIIRPLL